MEKRTKDNKYWEHVVRSNDHKAFVAQQKESSPWLEVRLFRRPEASFSGDPDDDIPLQNAASPTDESVRNRWRPLAIDAITVHIDGKSSCVIAVPLCTQELFENKFQTEYVIGARGKENEERTDEQLIGQANANQTCRHYARHGGMREAIQ